MDFPFVSIIIPVFNRESLILETLDSIKHQTYKNWECILIDDGSTDNTIKIINDYVLDDARFKLFKRPKLRIKGANSCRNYGFELSLGDYINWFDSDDIMHLDFIKNKIEAFNDSLDCVISKTKFFKEEIGNIIGQETRTKLSNNLLEDFVMLNISWYLPDPMWKKTFLEEKKLFSEVLRKGQDRDFHTRLLIHKPKIKIINSYLTYYRQHNITISNSFDSMVIQSYFNSLNERIDLLLNNNASKDLKFFLLKSQIKNYPYLYKNNNSFNQFFKVFKTLFVFNFKNLIWFFKFMLAVIFFNITGKGSFLLKG